MDEAQTQAYDELRALLDVAGALRIVTNEHACGAGLFERAPGFDHARCAAMTRPTAVRRLDADGRVVEEVEDVAVPLTDPRHYVHQPVVALDGPDARGLVTAYAEDGSYVQGEPAALLKRLREWRA